MTGWLYVAACFIAPALVALLLYALFSFWERRWRDPRKDDEFPPVDYSI